MTDRLAGLIVTLADDVREDDAEAIVDAIRMVKGVSGVAPLVADWRLHIAEDRARMDLQRKLAEVLWPPAGE